MKKIFWVLFLTTHLLLDARVHLFKKSEIDHLIGEMAQEHVQQHALSEEFLRNAFVYYFEQFDPDKIYLLEKEVSPYILAPPERLRSYFQQYQQHNYAVFDEMNQVIGKAIARAHAYREQLASSSERYFSLAQKELRNEKGSDWGWNRYAANEEELNKRQLAHLMQFLKNQMHKFGPEDVLKNREHIMTVYKEVQEEGENRFLGLNLQKKPLDEAHEENMEALLILKALAKSLDAHTAVFDASEASKVRSRLEKEYEGIGLTFEERVEGIFVKAVLPDSPASSMKQIQVGDRLLSINDFDVTNQNYATVMELLQGEKGEKVKLSLSHAEAAAYSVELSYALLIMQEDRVTVRSEPFKEGRVAMLTLNSFYQGELGVSAEQDMKEAINRLKSEGSLLGLVVDMRENSGGFLMQAVKVAGLFITNGVVVISKYGDGSLQIYRDLDSSLAFDGPLLILTSRWTASAAEIVAQALQDYGVALVIGDDRTYGKGTIQSQTVTNGDADTFFKVTVGKYYTVSGRTPQESGVLADIIVPGEHMNEAIGERYLDNAVAKDLVAPEYIDTLADIDPYTKEWYLRYYLPSLQKRLGTWQILAPALRVRSQQRIVSDADYRHALEERGLYPSVASMFSSGGESKISIEELQTREAFNILKDMINLKSNK